MFQTLCCTILCFFIIYFSHSFSLVFSCSSPKTIFCKGKHRPKKADYYLFSRTVVHTQITGFIQDITDNFRHYTLVSFTSSFNLPRLYSGILWTTFLPFHIIRGILVTEAITYQISYRILSSTSTNTQNFQLILYLKYYTTSNTPTETFASNIC